MIFPRTGPMHRFLKVFLVAGSLLAACAPPVLAQPQNRAPGSEAEFRLTFAPLFKRVAPAVVNIYTRRVERVAQTSPLKHDPLCSQLIGKLSPPGHARARIT